MSDYKATALQKFGASAVDFKFDDLPQDPKKKEPLPDQLKGVSVRLRQLSGQQYEDFMFSRMDEKTRTVTDLRGMRAGMVALCMVDDQDQPVFDDGAEVNAQLSNQMISWLFEACQHVNGATRQALEQAEQD